MALLYGYWQTTVFENKIQEDGTLPENDHGNIEIFYPGDVPKGAQHLKIRRGRYICKKNNIHFREAMIGFENGANKMSYPIIDGIIVLEKDVKKVMKISKKLEKERLKREEKRLKNQAKITWRLLIRKVCVKRYTAKLFDREVEDRMMDIPMSFK